MSASHLRTGWISNPAGSRRQRLLPLRACVLLVGLAPAACSQSLLDMGRSARRPSSGGTSDTVDVAAARRQRAASQPSARREAASALKPEAGDPDPTRSAFGPSGADPKPEVRRGPINVIRVNGDEITVEEILVPIYDELTLAAQTQSEGFYRKLVRERVGIQWRRHLERLLVYQEAARTLKEEQVEQLSKHAEKLFKERLKSDFDGVEQKFEVHARQRGWSREQELERLKREAVVSMWIQERFRPRVDITRAQLKKMYDDQIDQFTKPERRSMMLIDLPYARFLGPAARPTARDWAAARQNAHATMDRIREELASGVEFRAVAMQYSKGPNAGAGGVWESIRLGSLRPRYRKAVEVLFTLADGRISEPVETDEGVFLLKCTKIEPEQRVPFAEAQVRIRKELANRERREAVGDYIRKLMKQATVDPTEMVQFLTAVELAAPKHKSRTAGVQP